MDIKVLGPGCQKCKTLDTMVREVVAELNLQANIEKIEDIPQIVQYGVMLTPGLVVNGKVKASGKLPSKEELKKILAQEQ
ncbi:thioredoxin family protein [Desulforamulus aquiferis]|uniref:Thioredoxin family protein n=1 Tax=Desulforamulus aquiferis TaxID=1397668 RepID=A0AAW7ZE08_9FIRM|nr:thioredoxin family protein [Desulforamulus aquiferis]MDO7787668.1 thioredoxin family protein [Desulforamulus aquiferis]RYD05960.1 redox-active disulfide protein [Desulforamulus aquiferis]